MELNVHVQSGKHHQPPTWSDVNVWMNGPIFSKAKLRTHRDTSVEKRSHNGWSSADRVLGVTAWRRDNRSSGNKMSIENNHHRHRHSPKKELLSWVLRAYAKLGAQWERIYHFVLLHLLPDTKKNTVRTYRSYGMWVRHWWTHKTYEPTATCHEAKGCVIIGGRFFRGRAHVTLSDQPP